MLRLCYPWVMESNVRSDTQGWGRRLAAILAACALVAGLGLAGAGEIAELHAQLAGPVAEEAPQEAGDGVLRMAPERAPATDIVRIGLERVPGLADGPRYWVIIESDGDFRYVGEANVERMGAHTGTVPAGPLRLLLAYVDDIGFRQLEDTYTSRFLDNPTTYLMSEWPDETKVILNYAYSGPARLWAMGRLIDELLEEAEWHTD